MDSDTLPPVWNTRLLVVDKAVSLLVVVLLGIYQPDYVVVAAFFLIIPYLLLTRRLVLLKHLGVSSLIAMAWMIIAKQEYGYNQEFLVVTGIHLYPLFSWAGGLFIVYLVYSHYERLFHERGYLRMLLLYAAFYVPLLILVETIAYHVFDIKNVAAAAYQGLWLCDCIHAAPWMQVSYFLIGPVFFTFCYFLKLENPHLKN